MLNQCQHLNFLFVYRHSFYYLNDQHKDQGNNHFYLYLLNNMDNESQFAHQVHYHHLKKRLLLHKQYRMDLPIQDWHVVIF